MLYSQQQALDILRVDQSTFVYWMRAIPRIGRLKGRGSRFSRADLIALGVVVDATRGLGLTIGALEPVVGPIFDLLAHTTLGNASEQAVVIEDGSARLEKMPVTLESGLAAAVVPLRSTVERLKTAEGLSELLPLERLMFHRDH
jgi:hypothetical protein